MYTVPLLKIAGSVKRPMYIGSQEEINFLKVCKDNDVLAGACCITNTDSPGAEEAWYNFKDKPTVHLSDDLYYSTAWRTVIVV